MNQPVDARHCVTKGLASSERFEKATGPSRKSSQIDACLQRSKKVILGRIDATSQRMSGRQTEQSLWILRTCL